LRALAPGNHGLGVITHCAVTQALTLRASPLAAAGYDLLRLLTSTPLLS
jgi:hypothetical protein